MRHFRLCNNFLFDALYYIAKLNYNKLETKCIRESHRIDDFEKLMIYGKICSQTIGRLLFSFRRRGRVKS